MHIPGTGEPRSPAFNIAGDDAARLAADGGAFLERAVGVQWYEIAGNDADRAALVLCRLRRASAGQFGGPTFGDDAVRAVLEQASPGALVWIASRAISYMDENGFVEAVEPWLGQGPGDVST